MKCSKCKKDLPIKAFYPYDLNKCIKCRREYQREYYKKHPNRGRGRNYWDTLNDRVTGAKSAHEKVLYAIKLGRLVQGPCVVCGDPNSEAHHEDYNKPLDVIWLCHEHHMMFKHRKS